MQPVAIEMDAKMQTLTVIAIIRDGVGVSAAWLMLLIHYFSGVVKTLLNRERLPPRHVPPHLLKPRRTSPPLHSDNLEILCSSRILEFARQNRFQPTL